MPLPPRPAPTILHVDLDAFYAAVEQRDKPSLRGRPVVVGGVGGRGVVATASYEARAFGVRSAMSTREARARCPHAAYLGGRHTVYRQVSEVVMARLRACTELVEPLSLDEAFLDVTEAPELGPEPSAAALLALGRALKEDISRLTGGLSASVGIGTSKLVAKIASDLDKPNGLVLVPAGTEDLLLHPLPVGVIPGVGPATSERLRRVGIQRVGDVANATEDDLVRLLGRAAGTALHHMARAADPRPVVHEREAKSVSVEDTYDTDLVEPRLLAGLVDRQARKVVERLRGARLAGRTVTLKVRLHDFTTHSRSLTLAAPTDDPATVGRIATRLLREVDTADGVRLLGVGVSGLTDWIQEDLFATVEQERAETDHAGADESEDIGTRPVGSDPGGPAAPAWHPGADVVHDEHGPGWVWGAGLGRVTVRFETADTGPGPVRTLAADDPALHPRPPHP